MVLSAEKALCNGHLTGEYAKSAENKSRKNVVSKRALRQLWKTNIGVRA